MTHGLDGIIPARAGFTVVTSRALSPLRDHPRSRGVYQVGRGHLLGSRDHPRSRGVYYRPSSSTPAMTGSYPLARGLPEYPRPLEPDAGIIPARAGFTARRESSHQPSGDHPRSRGVYSIVRADDPDYVGSSPLARGLPGRAGIER